MSFCLIILKYVLSFTSFEEVLGRFLGCLLFLKVLGLLGRDCPQKVSLVGGYIGISLKVTARFYNLDLHLSNSFFLTGFENILFCLGRLERNSIIFLAPFTRSPVACFRVLNFRRRWLLENNLSDLLALRNWFEVCDQTPWSVVDWLLWKCGYPINLPFNLLPGVRRIFIYLWLFLFIFRLAFLVTSILAWQREPVDYPRTATALKQGGSHNLAWNLKFVVYCLWWLVRYSRRFQDVRNFDRIWEGLEVTIAIRLGSTLHHFIVSLHDSGCLAFNLQILRSFLIVKSCFYSWLFKADQALLVLC